MKGKIRKRSSIELLPSRVVWLHAEEDRFAPTSCVAELADYSHSPLAQHVYSKLGEAGRLPEIAGQRASLEEILASPDAFEAVIQSLPDCLQEGFLRQIQPLVALTRARVVIAHRNAQDSTMLQAIERDRAEASARQQAALEAEERAIAISLEDYDLNFILGEAERLSRRNNDVSQAWQTYKEKEQDIANLNKLSSTINDKSKEREFQVHQNVAISLSHKLTAAKTAFEVAASELMTVVLRQINPAINTAYSDRIQAEKSGREAAERAASLSQASKRGVVMSQFYDRCRATGSLDLVALVFTNLESFNNFSKMCNSAQETILSEPELIKFLFTNPQILRDLATEPKTANQIFGHSSDILKTFFQRGATYVLKFIQGVLDEKAPLQKFKMIRAEFGLEIKRETN